MIFLLRVGGGGSLKSFFSFEAAGAVVDLRLDSGLSAERRTGDRGELG